MLRECLIDHTQYPVKCWDLFTHLDNPYLSWLVKKQKQNFFKPFLTQSQYSGVIVLYKHSFIAYTKWMVRFVLQESISVRLRSLIRDTQWKLIYILTTLVMA